MLNYRNEAFFSNALVKALRSKGWFVQRIESGQVGRGIPDIFAISPVRNVPIWLELKREHTSCTRASYVEIHWRPGQQAWLNEVSERGVKTYTIACFNDGILQIPHNTIYTHNLVHLDESILYYKDIKELVK